MQETLITNCSNCGAPLNEEECLYCGSGLGVILRRVKQAATYVIAPKKKPKVAKIIQVCASNAREMREVANKNAKAHEEATCVAKIIKNIDKKVKSATEGGYTDCEIGQIYIRCNKYETKQIRSHYESLGFTFDCDIQWTNENPPVWSMAEFDTVTLRW